jgi:hypothetical protein
VREKPGGREKANRGKKRERGGGRERKRRRKGREKERETKKKEVASGQYGCAFVHR